MNMVHHVPQHVDRMTQSEIVTQHFNDPIGSVIKVNGKCYVKVSDKTHVIDTPVPTDESSVYFENSNDCESNQVRSGKLLCPPVGKLLFTVGEATAVATLCFDPPSMRSRPTQTTYVDKPFSLARVSSRVTMLHDNQPLSPTSPLTSTGQNREKLTISRLKTTVTLYKPDSSLYGMINKMVRHT